MAKLGSKSRPIIVRINDEAKFEEIAELCNSHGWHYIIGVEPDKPEDLTDLERALNKPEPGKTPKAIKTGRNDPCPCGSGKKYKKCCGAIDA